jgi:hypothetical protein
MARTHADENRRTAVRGDGSYHYPPATGPTIVRVPISLTFLRWDDLGRQAKAEVQSQVASAPPLLFLSVHLPIYVDSHGSLAKHTRSAREPWVPDSEILDCRSSRPLKSPKRE